jgi:hypothetical protein
MLKLYDNFAPRTEKNGSAELFFALQTIAERMPIHPFLHTRRLYFTKRSLVIALVFVACLSTKVQSQQYDLFEITDGDVYWRNTYEYAGNQDSLRREVVQMLKSKFYTFNVIRNQTGYNGEINHYVVDCRRYGRRYGNTPRIYWDGEWTGKFIVDVYDGSYRVTVYALYAEKVERTGYYKTETTKRGRYIDIVTRKDKSGFIKGELHNMALLSMSLKDQFDIKKTVIPNPAVD